MNFYMFLNLDASWEPNVAFHGGESFLIIDAVIT
jgi:hypothetical protein